MSPIESAKEPVAATPIRVLLIEDNPGFVYAIRDMLIRRGGGQFTLTHAGSITEALPLLHSKSPDLVLLDLGLPESAGAPTFDRFHAAAPFLPVIVLTALDDEAVALQTMRRGAQDYLVKDQVDPALLVRAIRYALERGRAEENLRRLSGRLLHLQDEERRHLARELHDGTAQHLAAASINLSALDADATGFSAVQRERIRETIELVRQCSTELRTMSYLLHPPLLEELGLAGSLRDFLEGFSRRSGIQVALDLPAALPRLPPALETTLFRIVQESLTNIQRHADSPTARVQLRHDGFSIHLQVADAGRGLPPDLLAQLPRTASGLGVGIAGMFERVRQLGGHLEMTSSHEGTVVKAVLPAGAPP